MEPQGIVKAFRKRKKLRENVHTVPLKIWKEETKNQQGWLGPITAYVLQAGIGQARAEIFCKQIIHNGGHICSQLSPDVTHVVVDEDMDFDRAFRLLKLKKLPQGLQLVKASWLSSCITVQQILDTTDYRLIIPEKYRDETGFSMEQSPLLDEDKVHPKAENTVMELKEESNTEISSFCYTVQRMLGDEEIEEDKAVVTLQELKALRSGQDLNTVSEGSSAVLSPGKWVCAQSSESKKTNHNQCITEKLEVLAKAYSVQGDKWRGLSYSKAINALKSYHKPVTSYQEACKIPGIGKQMAQKIVEILESGHLRKLDHISDSVSVLELFSNIWGAGVKTSQMWYQQGFRTLHDIRTRASLTSQQAIGLKYYENFLERMPRQEAAEIEQTVGTLLKLQQDVDRKSYAIFHQVRKAAQSIISELVCIACGSFRRGKPTCGDVDVLVTHPDGHSHQGVFSKLLNVLHKSGFLTDDLVNQEDNGIQQKYLGVCRLPGPDRHHRRLDIIVVPYREFACALLYFTGSAHFNRSMRALARTKGMSLSEHALCSGVVRGPEGLKTGSGVVLSTPTEKEVFAHLGLPYREPHERDW